ncbi:hypothetical protein DR999_PMT01791 [Platysternon megacephalum]|uniref:Uncharacterized protein n=1 Tax=Platysternon megacephalum TaxID=55544 RepID=A0A4D9F5T0_9SAUR|nr:hypothetical protein DR999_PMT01791 [Platysternon megacephalum]
MLWHQDTLASNSVRRNNYICFLFILGIGPKISWVQMFPALSCHGASKSGFINVIGAATLFYLALHAWEKGENSRIQVLARDFSALLHQDVSGSGSLGAQRQYRGVGLGYKPWLPASQGQGVEALGPGTPQICRC